MVEIIIKRVSSESLRVLRSESTIYPKIRKEEKKGRRLEGWSGEVGGGGGASEWRATSGEKALAFLLQRCFFVYFFNWITMIERRCTHSSLCDRTQASMVSRAFNKSHVDTDFTYCGVCVHLCNENGYVYIFVLRR